MDAKAQADDRRGITTATLALFAGGLGVFSAIITGLTFAHNRQTARETHALDEARLITERFTRAVDQLGSDKLDVRLGGIYALERIARDSKDDHPQVVEVLTAFIREHAPWPPRLATTNPSSPSSVVLPAGVDTSKAATDEPRPATDVQAALTVVGRRKLEHEEELPALRPPLQLSSTDLRRANVHRAHLEGADLRGAHLEYGDVVQGFRVVDRICMSVEIVQHLFGANRRPEHRRRLPARGARSAPRACRAARALPPRRDRPLQRCACRAVNDVGRP